MNKGSLYIGKVSGIKIFIHWTFIFLISWILIDNFRTGNSIIIGLYTVGFILSIFVCVTLHELGHALTAKYFKYHTKDIILLPIGGMARMDEIPENPKHELIVALAGPAVNILIALLIYPFIYWYGKVPTVFTVLFNTRDAFLFNLLVINLALAAFNLIPAFPMDGGRVFRSILAFFTNRVKATAIATRIGQGIAVIFFFIGILYNPVLIVIGIFIFMMAQTENNYVQSQSTLQGYTVKDVLMKKYFSLNASDTIDDAVKGLLDVQATDFLVMENGNVIGTLNRDRIIRNLTEKGKDASVALAMNTKVQFLSPEMPLDEVFLNFRLNENNMLPVMQDKQLVGVVDINNILEFIMAKMALEKNSAHLLPA